MQSQSLEKLKRSLSQPSGQVVLVVLVLALSLLVRLLVAWRTHGCDIDLGCFTYWFDHAARNGISGFYDGGFFCDYPPLNVYLFWIFGKLANALGPETTPFMVKLPGILFDIATAYLIFRFLRSRFSFRVCLAVMALYAFNPAAIFGLAVWGQMDSVYTFFMVASLYSALRSKYEVSGALLSLAILTKPQSIVLLPVLAYIILRNGNWKRAISSAVAFGAVLFVAIAPFNWDNPVAFLIDRYSGYGVYPYNSINAYNFWSLAGFWKPDTAAHLGLTYQIWGVLLFVALAALVMWQLHRRYDARSAIFAVFLLSFGFFMLMTRMHERYLFPVFALLAMGWYTRFTIWIYLGLTATFLAQLAYVLSVLNAGSFIPDGHWSIYVLAPANIILFGLSLWAFVVMKPLARPEAEEPAPVPGEPAATPEEPALVPLPIEEVEEKPPPPDGGPTPRAHAFLVALLVIIYLAVSVWNLGDLRAPSSDFTPAKAQEEVYLDLGQQTRMDKVYLLLQDATAVDVELYWGAPGNWTLQTSLTQSGVHRKWEELSLGRETRYVRFLFKRASGTIGEVALYSGGERLDIADIFGDRSRAENMTLIDEQDLFSNPASHKSGAYFDEIYFVRAAEDHMHLQEPSERTHPPMSKLIIAASIAVFGHNPFAWRIAGVLFAALMIPLIYLFSKRMFGSSRAGLIAAFLLTFDFMHFTQARLATGETFILFFVMAMFYFFYRYWQDPTTRGRDLFISLVFFGLGFSTKWVTMYGFVGMMLLLVLLKWRKPISRNEVLWFAGGVAAAVAIYLISYIPYFLVGHGLRDFWDFQFFMFRFHSGLEASHPFSSEWWTWPLMLRPLWLFVGYLDGTTSYIASMGNPALWWAGIPAMLATIWLAVRRNRTAAFLVIPFLAQWLIFIPITRVLFIYHFYPNVLFIILAATLWADRLWRRYGWGRWAVSGYLALNVICFVLFFPVISGLPMTERYWDAMRWMVSWVT